MDMDDLRFKTKSEATERMLSMVYRIAPSRAEVLITGEAGTGKELIAKMIHDKSKRYLKPFVAINCGALRETLLESELFGHEKGAFTGAYNRKVGLLEVAQGGTILLKEVDQMTPGIQAKLLRFLQEEEIYRVGGKDPIKLDVRLLTTTTKSLDAEVVRGNFREDLYYRINTIVVNTPPLRKRKEDIRLIAQDILSNIKLGRQKEMTEDALAVLENYEWPGNIRELRNVCERLNVLAHGDSITVNDLPEHIKSPGTKFTEVPYDPTVTLYEMEKRHIMNAIKYCDGNKTAAASTLGITIKTLYNKLHEYGEFDKTIKGID